MGSVLRVGRPGCLERILQQRLLLALERFQQRVRLSIRLMVSRRFLWCFQQQRVLLLSCKLIQRRMVLAGKLLIERLLLLSIMTPSLPARKVQRRLR